MRNKGFIFLGIQWHSPSRLDLGFTAVLSVVLGFFAITFQFPPFLVVGIMSAWIAGDCGASFEQHGVRGLLAAFGVSLLMVVLLSPFLGNGAQIP
jgi:hypothetical protein